ncbi:hypothetical protein JVU11DRAFT_703 [Chiua virens]|nr:hypothetical protein JVU11DRAFT_703 [Chiua virens]
MDLKVGSDGSNDHYPNSLDYFSHTRNIQELLHFKNDDSGCIEGKIFMTWPPRKRVHRLNLEVVEGPAIYRFEVEVPYKDGITFRPHERVSLALKGVTVDHRPESNAPHCIPIVLRFQGGVVFKYLSGINEGKVVDTWEGSTDEWYNPGMDHTVSDAIKIDARGVRLPPVPTATRTPIQAPSDVPSCHTQDVETDRHSPSIVAAHSATTVLSKRPAQPSGRSNGSRAARKKRRLLKQKELASANPLGNDADELHPTDVTTPCQKQPQTPTPSTVIDLSYCPPNPQQVIAVPKGETSTPEDSGIDHSKNNSSSASPLKAGVRTERGDIFTALSDLRESHSLINVIGIVTSVTPEGRSRTNDWTRSITLVDPSTIDLPRQSIKVNCFQKKYSEWLPQVQKDDIVILRKLKAVDFKGTISATGYGDKLRWAVYDLAKQSIRVPNKGDAPDKELVDHGMGYEYSPYWEPFQDSVELEYCRQMGEWWKLKRQKVSTVQCSEPPRKHLLISEASPDLPPRGFFNCTVEVLQKFNNQNGVTAVYITDYTTNPSVISVHAAWCSPELSEYVLRCDMWDDAKNVARMMNPGEYWYLNNIRARWNLSQRMEGTMQEAKNVIQLDKTRLEDFPHLRALLARKKEFALSKPTLTPRSTSLHIFPDMLLQDVEESTTFLTCVVELLHIELNSRDGHIMYVTDYTYNPDLPATASTASWAHNLEHRVVKIKLNGTQVDVLLDLRPGAICIIRNMHVKRLDASGCIQGHLGGEDKLIVPLHDLSDHHAQTLQRNKEGWQRENMLNVLASPPNGSHEESHELLKKSIVVSELHEVLASPAPNVFRVVARAMDFFPFSLADASVLRCTKCKSSPPPSFKQCPRCDDMMETHCKWFYSLYIQLQDEKGIELVASLSGKECILLQDVDPTDFRREQVAFDRFLAKLDPVLGNLRDVHLAWSRNEHNVIETPLMMFTLESWNIGDEKGYSLIDCSPK